MLLKNLIEGTYALLSPRQLKTLIVGRPLRNEHAEHEKLNVPVGLTVFSADALSSTAYATDEILIALAASGYAAQTGLLSLPVAIAIVLLILLVVISYRQVIKAYPEGGGAYIVARENLGVTPSHIAAAALLIDYVLTVSVSVSSGVQQITSTGWLDEHKATGYCVLCTVFILIMNLRGVRESGMAFAVPGYTFLSAMFLLIGVGMWEVLIQHDPRAMGLHVSHGAMPSWTNAAFILVFLKAFSHGCAGLTGIEAVSNGVKAFKAPAARRANQTMAIMGTLLSSIFLGITYLAFAFAILPNGDETILSQVSSAVFGKDSFLYLLVQLSAMVMLILAANTAFADFPRVGNLLADDGYLPRQLKNIGDRLVFNNGILILGVLSTTLIVLYHGDTNALIPLYCVGVFVSFTSSQAGMVRHHLREMQPGYRWGIIINGLGAMVTAVVTVILAIEKFREGAYIVLIAIPIIIFGFRRVKAHYRSVGKQLALDTGYRFDRPQKHKVLVLVSALGSQTIPALEYARSMSGDVEAVHVELNPDAADRLRMNWDRWGSGIPLVVLPSPYRSVSEPIVEYIDGIDAQHKDAWVTIIIPEFVPKKFWHNLLHNQTALVLNTLLRFRKGKIVTTVRYYLDE